MVFFFSEDRKEVCVDAYKGNDLVMEWAYPKNPIAHAGSLRSQALAWADQAVVQADSESKKKNANT